jgi:hypothetical protein
MQGMNKREIASSPGADWFGARPIWGLATEDASGAEDGDFKTPRRN